MYDVINVSKGDLLDLWEIVREYYARPLDHVWGT